MFLCMLLSWIRYFQVGISTLPIENKVGSRTAILVNFVALDGKSHWMEGVQLIAVYAILGIAFYFLPGWQ